MDSGNESTHFWHSGDAADKKSFVFFPRPHWLMLQAYTNYHRCVSSIKIIKFSFVRVNATTAVTRTGSAAWVTRWTGYCSFTDPAVVSFLLYSFQLKQQIWHELIWARSRFCENQIPPLSRGGVGPPLHNCSWEADEWLVSYRLGFGKLCQAVNTVTLTFSAWPRDGKIHLMASPVPASSPTLDR